MIRRRGELSAAAIDRGWPHQVAVRADQITGVNYDMVHGFCKGMSLCERGHSVQRDNIDYVVFCFADPAHAELFRGSMASVSIRRTGAAGAIGAAGAARPVRAKPRQTRAWLEIARSRVYAKIDRSSIARSGLPSVSFRPRKSACAVYPAR